MQKNNNGSVEKMKVPGMLILFFRTFEKRGLCYTNYNGYGEEKIFLHYEMQNLRVT